MARGPGGMPPTDMGRPLPARDEGGESGRGHCQVLVVDDEPMVATMLGIFLESSGHKVTTALTAARALAAIEENDFDLAVVDLTLPEMDGWEVCRRINLLRPNVAVIVATGWPARVEDGQDRGARINSVLAKPFGMHQLLDAVRDATAEYGRC